MAAWHMETPRDCLPDQCLCPRASWLGGLEEGQQGEHRAKSSFPFGENGRRKADVLAGEFIVRMMKSNRGRI